jgi:hypothetical protein
LNDIRKVIGRSDKERSLFGVVGADLVDPAQNQRASAKLMAGCTCKLGGTDRDKQERTYTDLAEPVYDLTPFDVAVEWHFQEEDAA